MSSPAVGGSVSPGFEEVEREFRAGFETRGELGAAVCAYYRGEKVVDLWGGVRDRASGAPWEEDTMVVVFSTTKGMAAVAMAVAHSRGLFELDEPVATYWPEFAQNGKSAITVRELLSHQAGLPAIDEELTPALLADHDRLAEVLARQRPAWTPGDRHGYHAISLGFFESELLRRVDPQRRTLGHFFRDEVARRLDISFYVGLPDDVPSRRLARIEGYSLFQLLFHLDTMPWRFVLGLLNPRSLISRSFSNPPLGNPAELDSPTYRALELPASMGIGEPRAVARVYSALAMGGDELGVTEETLEEIQRPPRPPPRGTFDEILKIHSAFGFGFLKPFPTLQFTTSSTGFGTPGAGGSFGMCDPDVQLGYCYAMNRMGFEMFEDPRDRALREAVYRCIRR